MRRWLSRPLSTNATLLWVFASLLIIQMLTAFFNEAFWDSPPLYLEYSFNIFKMHINMKEKLSPKKVEFIQKLIKSRRFAR